MKYCIALIRSGATASAVEGRYIGTKDEPVTQLEKERLCAKKENCLAPRAVYSGAFLRCRETANVLYPNHDIFALSDLRPLDYGCFTGENYIEMRESPLFEQWARSSQLTAFPGGEDLNQCMARNCRIFESVIDEAAQCQIDQISIIAHASFIRHVVHRFCVPRNRYRFMRIREGERINLIYDSGERVAYMDRA